MRAKLARSMSLPIALITAGLSLVASAPAAADGATAVAYGTGVTSCSISLSASKALINIGGIRYRYEGVTDCSVAIEQSGQATLYAGSSVVDQGPLCSGFLARCSSSGSYLSVGLDADHATYVVRLIAPLGQGWLTASDQCSGAGTDNLRCTFTDSTDLFDVT